MKCYKCKTQIPKDVQICPSCHTEVFLTEETLKQALEKDEKARERIYNMAYGLVFSIARASLSADDTDDAVQEIFIKIFNNLHKLSNARAFTGWVRTISANHISSLFRSSSVRREKDTVLIGRFGDTSANDPDDDGMYDSFGEETAPVGSDSFEFSDPSDIMEYNETVKILDTFSKELPDKYRVLFSLVYVNQFTTEQAADILGIPSGTVKTRMKWIREQASKIFVRNKFAVYSVSPAVLIPLLGKSLMYAEPASGSFKTVLAVSKGAATVTGIASSGTVSGTAAASGTAAGTTAAGTAASSTAAATTTATTATAAAATAATGSAATGSVMGTATAAAASAGIKAAAAGVVKALSVKAAVLITTGCIGAGAVTTGVVVSTVVENERKAKEEALIRTAGEQLLPDDTVLIQDDAGLYVPDTEPAQRPEEPLSLIPSNLRDSSEPGPSAVPAKTPSATPTKTPTPTPTPTAAPVVIGDNEETAPEVTSVPTPAACSHNSVPVTQTVHHDAVYGYYVEYGRRRVCTKCGQVVVEYEDFTIYHRLSPGDALYDHAVTHDDYVPGNRINFIPGETLSCICYSVEEIDVLPGEKTIEEITVSEAYDETIVTGHKCSLCGIVLD